ncbi:MAG TPA: X-Pro aminopeptidase, partial [Epsilonproteobacteria bacterium]|nr:X-Pro aminopeptidase [Campylobacterota bacterium]
MSAQNYILRDENSIYYECGYSCDNALYLKLGSEAFFITDSRYELDARENVQGADVIVDRNLAQQAANILNQNRIKKVTFDPNEWSVASFSLLSNNCHVEWIEHFAFSHQKRIIKTPKEQQLLAKAAIKGAKAFKKFIKTISKDGIGKDEYHLGDIVRRTMTYRGRYEV